MATSSRTSQPNLLRRVYENKLRVSFNLRRVLLQALGRQKVTLAPGEHISIPLHAGAGSGHIWSSTGTTAPPSHEIIERATFTLKWLNATARITGDFDEDTASQRAAEEQAMRLAMRTIPVNGGHDLSFDLYGDGSGKLTTIASASSATEFVVDSIKGLRNGMLIDVLKISTGTASVGGVTGASITVNTTTKTVTLTGGAQLADGSGTELNSNASLYAVYRHGSYNDAVFGLEAIVSASNPTVANYGGIDRSDDANDFYRAIEHGSGVNPRTPTPRMLADLIDDIEIRGNGMCDLILCPYGLWNVLVERIEADKRYDAQRTSFRMWAEALTFGADRKLVKDKHCPDDRIYCLDTRSFKIYQTSEGKWDERGGSILKHIDGSLSYDIRWHRRLQLICDTPNANGVLLNLSNTLAA